MNEIITVGIPAFNEEEYIYETINSLLNQKMENWKAIVSDNCSTDDTYKIAKEFSLKDKRIILHRQENKISAVENFLFVLKECKSKYFSWLGAHDIFEKEYLDHAVTVLERNKKVSMVYPKAIFIDKNGRQTAEADSDISSNGLNRYKRMCKVAQNLSCCTAIHGIFRSKILMTAPFKNTIGADHLVLFSTASHGELYELPFIGIKRRQVRTESPEEKKRRWEKEGLFESYNDVKPHAFLIVEHLVFILQAKHLTIQEKIRLLLSTGSIFKNRFNLSLLDIFNAYSKK